MANKTAAVQEEFEKLMSELHQKRDQRDTDCFYEVMDQYYGRSETDTKHASPTKRLIKHKNTAVENKKVLNQNVTTDGYAITYTTAPGKSYVVEPKKEIDYKLLEKNPEKFYESVFTSEVTTHKAKQDAKSPVRRAVTISSKTTTRPHVKMMDKIKSKIVEKLREKIG